ncbi:hypothetical protein [Aeromicrobium stalagmiti]|uniref:hypothetical protein n=1 Tax=Aeromicrobium stalagmiti TaxID=2738988 RepID=UPI0015689DEF|nr:hypothetical protein [Aeromicrobium stalagmiti]NRQ48883.1 hypothetical protein [Aeromicrobium stalagmiti]
MRKILVVISALALSLGLAPSAQAAKKFTVSSKLEDTSLTFGQQQRVTGSVSPASPGKTVKVYIHYASDSDGEYHYLGKSTLSASSRFSKSFTPTDSGTTKIKVVKAASGSRASGSSTNSFKNYGYRRLSTLPRTIESGVVANDDTFTIGGLDSTDGYRFQGGNGRARWSTSGQCKEFVGYGGVPDSSTGTQASANYFARATATGAVLVKHEGPFQQTGDRETIRMKLYKKTDSGYTFARYLQIATQEQGGVEPRYGLLATYLHCNLPGAEIDPNLA